MAQELVVFRLRTHDAHAERGIREGLLDDSNELNDILGHRNAWGKGKGNFPLTKVQGILDSNSGSRKHIFLFFDGKNKNVLILY